jgi:hypothetical protein
MPIRMNSMTATEQESADALSGDFDSRNSRALAMLHKKYPVELSLAILRSLTMIISIIADVPLRRNLTRRKSLLLKWIEDNYEALEPVFNDLELI